LGVFAVALGAVALSGVAAVPAAASNWKVATLADGPITATLEGMSCPSASLCVAVGTNSTIATSTNPTGGPSAWKTVHPEGYVEHPGMQGLYTGNAIRGVSCPSSELCVAVVSNPDHILTSTNPTGGASAWQIIEMPFEAFQMHGISCPSSRLCVAVSVRGRVITSTNPTAGASAWTITTLEEGLSLDGISCASESLCVAVGSPGKIFVSTDPTGGASAWKPASGAVGIGNLYGVSCPSPSLCVGATVGLVVTSTNPSADTSSWTATAAGLSVPVTAVSCTAASECAATDNNGDVITSTDPTGGSAAWSFTNVLPRSVSNGFFGISCPSKSLCAVAGADDQIITSTEPFAGERTPLLPPTGHSGGRHAKRPRVKITGRPPRRVAKLGQERVHFRFRAIGAASGFLCSFDRAPFTRCHSPKSYEAVPGEHVFKVKAFGPGGISRVPAIARFRDRCRAFCGAFTHGKT